VGTSERTQPVPSLTPNYDFNLPLVNDPIDADLWGGQLNANWSSLDTILKTVQDTADTAATLIETGDMIFSFASSKTGFVLATGSIGSASSSATTRANADTEDLFTLFWNGLSDTLAPVSGGRGADAATDFSANKTLTVPDMQGRTAIGRDNMSGTSQNRITIAGCGVDGDVLGYAGGSEFMQLHTHTLTDPGHVHSGGEYTTNGVNPGGTGMFVRRADQSPAANTASATTGISIGNTGSGSSQNVQPSIVQNAFYKL